MRKKLTAVRLKPQQLRKLAKIAVREDVPVSWLISLVNEFVDDLPSLRNREGPKLKQLVLAFLFVRRNPAIQCYAHFFPSFFGRPPRFPFFRAASAFAFDVTEPPFFPIPARYFFTAAFIAEPP
jgi:hypothetical protein